MESELVAKIRRILEQNSINEDQARSLMVLLRKRMEFMSDQERTEFTTVTLFCNWVAHTAITQSVTGLMTLRRINDTLVRVKGSSDGKLAQLEMSRAIGFGTFREGLFKLLATMGIKHRLANKQCWAEFLVNILELIRDVPLLFPPIAKLKGQALNIYRDISKNPIRPGAGVVEIKISKIDYSSFDKKSLGETLCLLISTENRTTVIIPLVIEE